MTGWLLRRVGQAVVTVGIALALLFVLMRAAPGDPLARLAGDRPISAEELAELRARYDTDAPLARQAATFVSGAVRGDLGVSITYARPVTALLAERIPATLLLGGTVLFLNFTLGIWIGARQAVRRGGPLDRVGGTAALVGYATPSFWLGLVLAWLVGIEWRLLPVAGLADPLIAADAGLGTRIADRLSHLVLPAVTLCVVSIASTMRHQRSAMIEALAQPFVQTARAKGLSERRVVWAHAWRTALFPVVTLVGLWLPILVTGSVFVETVFAWPGLGSLATEAVATRDYPLLMGTALLVSVTVVAGTLLADLAYALLDPRVRLA